MKHLFPPLLAKQDLQPPVLVLAAHPDDEVIACGGMLAWHRQQGHAVMVVHMTDGAQGDPAGKFGDIAEIRRKEGREALRRLGVKDVRSLDFPDGQLPELQAEISSAIGGLIAEIEPCTIYSFFFAESHRDHRAVSHALCANANKMRPDCRCLLYGVNQVVVAGSMFEVGAFMQQKQHALAAFASQLAYNNFAEKTLHRDHAATVNVEDPAVQYAELFADLLPADLQRAKELTDPLIHFLLGDRSE